MKFQLAHLSLFPPDELLSYWFVSHDFAAELKLDYSRQAAAALKGAVAPRGVRIDYEADAVTIRISRNELVIPTLESIYALIGWETAELAQLKPQVERFKRPRPRSLSVGDIFHIPFAPDLVGLGQVLDINQKAPTVAIFTCVGSSSEVLPTKLPDARPLTILHIGGNSLYKGAWSVVGSVTPTHDPTSGPGGKLFTVGSKSYGGDGPIVRLLQAHAGIRSWSEGFHDPHYLEQLVLAHE